MRKKAKKKAPQYKVWMNPSVFVSRKKLPGKIRQRIRHLLDDLEEEPRPPKSKILRLSDIAEYFITSEWELRRVRLEDWRVIYAVNEKWSEISVLTIRKRPPYDYEDLEQLVSEFVESVT